MTSSVVFSAVYVVFRDMRYNTLYGVVRANFYHYIPWCELLNSFLLMTSLPASAFSERYLGQPKPDPRAYAVCLLYSAFTWTPYVGPLCFSIGLLNNIVGIHPQMANLAHRASQFLDKKFLIVHPTADGTRTLK